MRLQNALNFSGSVADRFEVGHQRSDALPFGRLLVWRTKRDRLRKVLQPLT